MAVDYDPVKMATVMMESALHILDDAGERDAAIDLQQALSTLLREPIPTTVGDVDALLDTSSGRLLLERLAMRG
jgi:hypothetical protein